MKISKNDILFISALILSIWFTGTAYIWVYWASLIISYPFGIISFLIWLNLKKDGKKRNKIIPIVLIIGLIFSLGVLVAALIRN